MTRLADQRCVPSRPGMPAVAPAEAAEMVDSLDGWQVRDARLCREWKLADFAAALAFVVRIGAVAEAEDHHPDIELSWGRVRVTLWTHVAGGLTINDFIVAAKIDAARDAEA